MIRLSAKGYTLAIVILITGVFIIPSASISAIEKQKTPNVESIDVTIQTTVDPKIMDIIEMVNESLIRGYLESLVACGPRMTGTYGCEKAAEYIYEQFEDMDLETRYHDWMSFGDRWHKGFFKSQNVEATLEGIDNSCDEILIFNAHYDTVKVSPGANDDGSGTAAVIAAAYVLSQFEFKRTIKFVTFSGEEIGLRGSRAYVKEIYSNNEDILVEFNADMIGHAVTAEGGETMGFSATEDAGWIVNTIENLSTDYNINFQINRYKIDRLSRRGWSDYYPFVQYGYEAIGCWESDGDPNMHTPDDDLDNVNISYLVNTTRLIVGTLAYLADVDNVYPQIKIASPRRGRLYYKDRTVKDFRYEKTMVVNDVLVWAEVKPGDAPIDQVEFYYDGKLEHSDTELPFQWRLNKLSMKKHEIEVIVYDELGKSASDKMEFFFINLNKEK